LCAKSRTQTFERTGARDLPPTVRLIGIGFYIGLSITLGALGGRFLDGVLETGKVMTVSGIVLGLFLALYGALTQLFDVLAQINRRRGGSGK